MLSIPSLCHLSCLLSWYRSMQEVMLKADFHLNLHMLKITDPTSKETERREANTETTGDSAGRPKGSTLLFWQEAACLLSQALSSLKTLYQLFSFSKAALLSPACVANDLHSHLLPNANRNSWTTSPFSSYFSHTRCLLFTVFFAKLPQRVLSPFPSSFCFTSSLWEDSQGCCFPLHP